MHHKAMKLVLSCIGWLYFSCSAIFSWVQTKSLQVTDIIFAFVLFVYFLILIIQHYTRD